MRTSHVPDGRRRLRLHSRQGGQTPTDETTQSCRAIRSCRYGYLEETPGNLGQAKSIIKLAIGEQSGVRCDPGTVELQLQATVEIDPQMGVSGFTRRVTRGWLVVVVVSR